MILTGIGIIDSEDTGTLLLDAYPNAAQAYSLRLLRVGYSGNCIRVRRSSDNTEKDFGFVNGFLDIAAVLSFTGTGGTNFGYVTTWYDQSGNVGNATQGAASNQPQIVANGALRTSNGRAAIWFGSQSEDWYFGVGNVLNSVSTLSWSSVWTLSDGPTNGAAFGPAGTANAGKGLEFIQQTTKPTVLRLNGVERATGATTAGRLWNSGTQTITMVLGNSTSVQGYKNQTAVTMVDSTAMPVLNHSGTYELGAYYARLSYSVQGFMQEVIIWTTNQTNNYSNIITNTNNFYGTY